MKELTHLKTRLVECEHPIGIKRTSNWKLPPIDFVYGKKEKEDKEGVSVVTRSWIVHKPSKKTEPPQDFVQINKIAIKMNATNHTTHKDYRQNVNIKRKIPKGSNERKIYLPADEFTYGRKNRTPTPVKDVINYEYARKAEDVIKQEYTHFMTEKIKIEKLSPKTTKHFSKLLEKKKSSQKQEQKELYKLKMFRDVDSKVRENLRNFKTYSPKKDNLDCLIEKVECELKELEQNKENHHNEMDNQ